MMNRSLATFSAAEERNKLSHFTVQDFDLKGIVQAGANDGEEMINAVRLGVEHYVAFEPLSSAYDELTINCHLAGGDNLDYHMFQLGLDDFDGTAQLKVTAGDGKGSSLYEGVWDHPEVKKNWTSGQSAYIGEEQVAIQKFTTWADDHPEIDLSLYDTLQLDTQGNEHNILKGMGDLLQGFKFLAIEISEVPVYIGETPGGELSDWLDELGFLRDSPITAHNDTFYIRKDIKAETDGQYKGRC